MELIDSIHEVNFSSLNGSANTTRSADDSTAQDHVDMVIRLTFMVILFISMISVCCTLELSRIKKHFFNPKGIAVAVGSQFCIMPLAAFCLAKLFQLSFIENLTVLICGCCPGGHLSNIFSLALDGDMNLSIMMTVCSMVLALGMMPFMLYIYSTGFTNLVHFIPYSNIILSLMILLVPCGLGILINYKVPQYSKMVTKVGLTIAVVIFILVCVFAGFFDGEQKITIFSPQLLAIAGLMPLIGFICGYVLAAAFGMNEPRTVSMEVGCQNIQLCTTILKVAFPSELIGLLYLFPALYCLFQVIEGFLLIFLFRCHRIMTKQPKENEACMAGETEESIKL